MLLGRVTGTVLAAARDKRLDGATLLVVQTVAPDGSDTPGYAVAVDAVGAGVGDLVLYTTGSQAGKTDATERRPADAAVVAIVDAVELGAKTSYKR